MERKERTNEEESKGENKKEYTMNENKMCGEVSAEKIAGIEMGMRMRMRMRKIRIRIWKGMSMDDSACIQKGMEKEIYVADET